MARGCIARPLAPLLHSATAPRLTSIKVHAALRPARRSGCARRSLAPRRAQPDLRTGAPSRPRQAVAAQFTSGNTTTVGIASVAPLGLG